MSGEHSTIPPSSAARRVQCPGSNLMESLHPETEESDDAREGTASHELAALMVESASRARTAWPDEAVGQAASNGVIWTQESYDAAEMYAEAIREVMLATSTFTPHVEDRVEVSRIHPELWGTTDCWLFDKNSGTLYDWDYKYGHRPVEIFENWQMIEYVTGILDKLEIDGLADQHTRVVMTIVQPRAYHRDGPIRSWSVLASDLRGYVNRLIDVEAEALGPDPGTRAGAECRDCTARHACDTLHAACGSVLEFVGKPIPVSLEPDAVGTLLVMYRRAADILKAGLSGLEAHAEGLIASGGTVPGFAMEQGYGRQKWTEDNDSIIQMCDLLSVDIRKPAEPVTPKQALKLGVDESVITEYSITPRTDAKLVPATQTIASAVFSKRKT